MKTNAAVAGLIALGCLCLSFSPRITDSPAAGETASSSVSTKTDSLQREVRRFEDTVRQMEKELGWAVFEEATEIAYRKGIIAPVYSLADYRFDIASYNLKIDSCKAYRRAFDDAEEQLRQVLMQDSAYLSLMRHLPEKDGKPDYERLKAGQELIFTRLSHTSEEYRWKREIRERRLLESNTALLRTVAAICRRQNREVPPFPVPHLQNKIQKDAEAIGSDLATYLSPDKEMEMKYSDELRQAIASLEEAREALWLTRQDLYRLQDERK